MIGVNGWCSAKRRSPVGIASVGTKALLMNGRIIRNIGVLLAVSTLSAARPIPTVSQVSENAVRISSAFVPTDAMPAGLRYFAEHQPFTPIIDTLRALLTGAPTGSDLWLAIGWCVLISLLGYAWSRRLFLRVPAK